MTWVVFWPSPYGHRHLPPRLADRSGCVRCAKAHRTPSPDFRDSLAFCVGASDSALQTAWTGAQPSEPSMFTGKKRDGDGRMKRQKPLNPKKGDSGSGKPNRTEQRLRAQKEAIEAKLVAIERAKAPPTAQATRTAAREKPAEDTKNFGDQRVVIKFFYASMRCSVRLPRKIGAAVTARFSASVRASWTSHRRRTVSTVHSSALLKATRTLPQSPRVVVACRRC